MTTAAVRVLVADDERPARRFLISLLKKSPGAQLVGEAGSGAQAIQLIESERPDLALLDLQMPQIDGLEVVRRVKKELLPLVAYVTAFDDFAVEAFELNAIDYILKPVQQARLDATLERARERLGGAETAEARAAALVSAAASYGRTAGRRYLERIPVRRGDEVLILPVRQIASIVAERELLHLTTMANEEYTITYRLHVLESRLDPRRFIRLGRGTLVNLDLISRINAMPGGSYTVALSNGQELPVSRIQSRTLRDTLLKL